MTLEKAPALTEALIAMFEEAKLAGAEFAAVMQETFEAVGDSAVKAIEGIIASLGNIPQTIPVSVVVNRTHGGGIGEPATPAQPGGRRPGARAGGPGAGAGGPDAVLERLDDTIRGLPSQFKRSVREGFQEAF